MRKLRSFSYFLILLTLTFTAAYGVYEVALSHQPIVVKDLSCACTNSLQDSFEQPLKYVRGSFKGQCVNSCTHRFPTLVRGNPSKQTIEVSNTYHAEKFWTAQVPLSLLESVDIVFETFAPGINHVSMRFNFTKKNQVLLRAQNSMEAQTTATIDSFVVSPEAALPSGVKYSLKDGLMGNYVLMNRMISTEQYVAMIERLDHPVRFYRTKLNPVETQRLFQISLLDSREILNNPYQLFFNNCATSVIDYNLKAKKKMVSLDWDVWDVLDPLRGIPSSTTLGTLRTLSWWDIIDLAKNEPQ